MKIVFTGGGTGGHFYPLIAVAQEVNEIVIKKKFLSPKMYYVGPGRYDKKALRRSNIVYMYIPAGKIRRQGGLRAVLLNMLDIPKTGLGVLLLFFRFVRMYPDVIFSKGGYASFPVLVVARILHIPLVIHDSDAVPGRATLWAAPFARNIAISYPEAESFFRKADQEKIALTGNPIRQELIYAPVENPESVFHLEKTDRPTLIVLGGSLGAEFINRHILDVLDQLVKSYRIIHITGREHLDHVKQMSGVISPDGEITGRYIPVGWVNSFHLRALYSMADAAISRAGSGTLVELATWGIPTIVIPIPQDVSRDQVKNAYAFSRVTGSFVVEQQNLSPNLLKRRIDDLFDDNEKEVERRKKGMNAFAHPEAARSIANVLVDILAEHQV